MKYQILCLLFIFIYSISVLSTAQRETNADIQDRADKIAKNLQGAYLIAKNGEILAQNAFGSANKNTAEKNSVDTKFRLASLTKTITAVAVMQLYEKKQIDLQAFVSDYLDDYGSNGKKIRIHHLLTHSSGIPDYIGFISNPSSPKDIIDSFKSRPLQFTPGTTTSYSNSNFALLGYLIEKITDKKYDEYLQEHIWDVAEMRNSGFHFPKTPGKGFACPSGGNPNGPWESNAKAYSAGALYSSVKDVFKFFNSLDQKKLLSAETIKLMQKAHVGNKGYGFFVSGNMVSHNGIIPGFTAQFYRYPNFQGLIIVLSNGGNAASVANQLKNLFLN